MAREAQRGQPAAMIMKVILTNVSYKKRNSEREGERQKEGGEKEKWARSIRRREIDGRLTESRREGARMRGLSLPPTTETCTRTHPRCGGRERTRGGCWVLDGPPGSTSPRRRLARRGLPERWGNVRGMLEGWGCYIRPARGGESSVHPRGAYRSRSIGRTIVAPGVDPSASRIRGTHTQLSYVAGTNGERNVRRDSEVCLAEREEDYDDENGEIWYNRKYILAVITREKRRERRSPSTDNGHGRVPPLSSRIVPFRGEKRTRRKRASIDRSIEQAEPRRCGPYKLVFADGRALCLRVVTLAGVRAARCRITRFPVFLSGGAWCRLGFFVRYLFSLSLFSISISLFVSASLSSASLSPLAPSLCFIAPSHLSLFSLLF